METKELNGHKISKKEARQLVYDKLVAALAEFKPAIKTKKFENNLRRTSKLFAPFMIKASAKDKVKTIKAKVKKEDQKPGE